jgi:hypothetical protein
MLAMNGPWSRSYEQLCKVLHLLHQSINSLLSPTRPIAAIGSSILILCQNYWGKKKESEKAPP